MTILRPDFYVEFKAGKKLQWVNVYLWDVHPNTFAAWKAGRWGYFLAKYSNPAIGYFGDLHFVLGRLRMDTISHELDHVRAEWIAANRVAWSRYTEEKFIVMKDRMTWKFLRELSKIHPQSRVWMKTLSEL